MVCDLQTRSEPGLNYLVHNLSLMSDQRASGQLVGQIEMRSSVFQKMNKIIRDGPGIHLAALKRHRAWQVHRTDNDYAVSHDFFPGLGQRAVPALLGGEVNNDGSRPHPADHFLGNEDGSTLPWNQGRRDDDVGGGHILGHHFLLFLVELLGLRLGITALSLGIFGGETELGKLGAEALHLLLYGWAGIVRLDDSSEPLRRANSL